MLGVLICIQMILNVVFNTPDFLRKMFFNQTISLNNKLFDVFHHERSVIFASDLLDVISYQ